MGTPRAAGRWFVGFAALTAATLTAACSGGGGGDDDPPAENDVTAVSFGAASASSSEIGGAVTVQIVLGTTLVSLDEEVTVSVADSGAGSATSGADYDAFATQVVTFPIGSVDGDVQNVTITPIDDANTEASETVVLVMSSPSANAQLLAPTGFTLTITDDDSGGPASFVATEGATGVENSVAHNSTLDVGPLPVGLGPNAGTLVRVTNAGGLPMDLAAPRLTGSNANDFVVEIESAPLSGLELIALGAEDEASPLVSRTQSAGPGAAAGVDLALLAEMAEHDQVVLHGFPAPGLGDVTLALRRRPLPFASDAVLKIDGVEQPGGPRALVGDLSIWTGAIVELDGSRVFLALSSAGAQGFVELPLAVDRYLHVVTEAPEQSGEPARVRIVREQELAALGLDVPPSVCSQSREVPGREPELVLENMPPPIGALTAANCRLAIETDYQLFQKFANSGALTTYVTELVAAVSDQYFIDVQTTLSIAYLGVYTTAGDPWSAQDSGGDAGDVLDEFRAAWNTSGWPASADLAHFVSGASLGGGVAYVNVLCNQSFGYGVSGNISGLINWGSWTGAAAHFTWDFVVVAHELGHNFGSSHTHSYCPPLDQCYTNCNGSTTCTQGTIMSYCHTCGGMDNIDLYFHPVTANIMRGAVNSSCLGRSELAGGDWVQYHVRFNPLTAQGIRNATLEFGHDAGNVSTPFRILLTGEAE